MKTKSWTQYLKERRARHPKILADINSGLMTSAEIGQKYDITKQAITYLKFQYGIALGRTKKKWTDGDPITGLPGSSIAWSAEGLWHGVWWWAGSDGFTGGVGENMNDEERYLIDILETLKAEYMKAARPYLLWLARIREREAKPNILLSAEQASRLMGKKPWALNTAQAGPKMGSL